ncbi:hypothetical protein LHA01_11020 [Schleiferilactobacillus harbinensis]|nr:hypothetical protein LHA01_11020 [Schleiferilactobacillus harbinensis]
MTLIFSSFQNEKQAWQHLFSLNSAPRLRKALTKKQPSAKKMNGRPTDRGLPMSTHEQVLTWGHSMDRQ